jgi:SAM-dependent methyltransferase
MGEASHHPGVLSGLLGAVASSPLVYDIVQRAAGANSVRKWLAPFLVESASHTLLDIGAGTGAIKSWIPPSTDYIWIDNDPKKLLGYRSRGLSAGGVLTDASQLCFADKSIDYALCMAVSHHLTGEEIRRSLQEISRVVRHRLFFVDALDSPRIASRALWRLDRGSYPRTSDVLLEHIGQSFDVERVETFQVLHRYILCIARPKSAGARTAAK